MSLVMVTYRMQTHGYGLTQTETEEIADIHLSGGSLPGEVVSRTIERTVEDELTAEGERLIAEGELPGRWARPGLRIVDGGSTD